MKTRRRRLLVAATLVVAALLAYAGWKIYASRPLLQRFVVTKIETTLGGVLNYRDLQPTWRGVDLRDLSFQPRTTAGNLAFRLRARQASIRVNYLALLRDLFAPAPRVIQISVYEPVLTVSPAHASPAAAPAQAPAAKPPARDRPIRADLRTPDAAMPAAPAAKYLIIENVEIHHGRIAFADSMLPQPVLTIVSDINGWLHARGETQAQVRLHGNVQHPSTAELTLSTVIDMRRIALDSIRLDISDLQLQGRLPLALPGRMEMAGGTLGGSLIFARQQGTAPGAPANAIAVGGHLHLRQGKFYYTLDEAPGPVKSPAPSWLNRLSHKLAALTGNKLMKQVTTSLQTAPLVITEASFDATLQDGRLNIANGRQLVNAQPLHFNGRVQLGELPFWMASLGRSQNPYALKIAAERSPADSQHTAASNRRARAPTLELHVGCDSLSLHDFLAPFRRTGRPPRTTPAGLISGLAAIHASITGTFFSPHIQASLVSPFAIIGDKRLREVKAQFEYGSRAADTVAAGADHSLHWRASGMLDLAYERAVHLASWPPEFQWEGWGKVDLSVRHLPIAATVVVEGRLTPLLSRLLARHGFKYQNHDAANNGSAALVALPPLPQTRMASVAQISGSFWKPLLQGRMTVEVQQPAQPATRWLGNFAMAHDTLRLSAAVPQQPGKVHATFWRLGGRRLIKKEGLELEALPALFGEKLSRSLLADLDVDFNLEGHSDSLNLNLEVRRKGVAAGLLRVVGYMLPLLQGERVTSGYVKVFPGRPNEFTASYTLHVQDSLLRVTDFRCEPWLHATFEVQTGGRREVKGALRLSGADLSRLVNGAAGDSAAVRGKLFGEMQLTGRLDDPRLAGHFWLFDGFLHEVGNLAISGEIQADRSGWRVDSLQVSKDNRPCLLAKAGYRRSDRRLHIAVRGNEIRSGDLLQALTGIPAHRFDGATTLQLTAEGPAADFWSENGVPLSGTLLVRDVSVLGTAFAELGADLDSGSRERQPPARLSRHGIYLPRLRLLKQEGFSLTGEAFLPFNSKAELRASLSGGGNLLAILPEMSTWFKPGATSESQLSLNLRGPYSRLTLYDSRLRLRNGTLPMARLTREITDLNADFTIDGRGTFIAIPFLQARIGEARLSVRNVEHMTPLVLADASTAGANVLAMSGGAGWEPLQLGNSPLHLGTILVKSSENGLPLSIPGLMRKHEIGRFRLTGLVDSTASWGDADEFMIGGPWAHPRVQGRVVFENVEFQFPFLEESDPVLRHLLRRINWNVVVESRKDNHYVRTIPTAFNNVYIDLGIDDARSRLHFAGIVDDTTYGGNAFHIEGSVLTTRGEIEYLDMNFEVEEFGAEFDKSQLFPMVYGRAKTVVRDSSHVPYNVYLTLVAIDSVSGREEPRGRLQHAVFKLVSDRPNLPATVQGQGLATRQEQVLASLGYSMDRLGEKATEAVGIGTDNLILRPFLRPVERAMQRTLGLDVVRFSSRFTRNFLTTNLSNNSPANTPALPDARRSLFRSSRLTIGKYLLDNLYLSYIGQLESGAERDSLTTINGQPLPDLEYKLQLRHRLGLEYRLNPDMLLQVEYDFADE
ncbi:MAG: DUF748 domain-containing protein, partial [candidate division KSB1 bacterium]|nr:DUF748 domain-containing protein [candidate division KSB1 bacterium]